MKHILRYTLLSLVLLVAIATEASAKDINYSPFLVVQTATQYPTLQEAVDAAVSGYTIKVLSGSEFGVAEYNASTYSTDNTTDYYKSNWGGEVFIKDKSLTIIPEDEANPTPLEDFVFVIAGSATQRDITLDGLKLTGKSKIMVYPGDAGEGINKLTIQHCYMDVNGGVPSNGKERLQNSTLHGGYGFPNYTNYSSVVFCGTAPEGDIISFEFAYNKYLNRNAGRCISGRGKFRYYDIHDNIIGAEDCRFDDHFMTTEDSGYSASAFTFKIHGNTFFSYDTSLLLYFTTGSFSNTQTNNVYVYDNKIDMTPAGRLYFNDKNWTSVIFGTKIADIKGGTTTLTTYDNTVNDYCYNYIKTNGESEHCVVNAQLGHTYAFTDAVPSRKTKAIDDVYHDVANVYDESTGTFTTYDLSTTHYCTHCDGLTALPSATIKINRSGLQKDETAIFDVFRMVDDVKTFVMRVSLTGTDSEGTTVSRKLLNMEPGTYVVEETAWSWAYEKGTTTVKEWEKTATTSSANGTGTGTVAVDETLEFTFTGAPLANVTKHAEDAKVNQFSKETTVAIEADTQDYSGHSL